VQFDVIVPSVADRVVQQALVQKMTPIFEPLFADCSFGYRPGRSPHMAMRKVWREINEGNLWILDADLRSYLDRASYCPQAYEGCSKRSG
jgi:RNA-directed DNA polymerase